MSIVEKELKHNPNAFGYFNLGVQYRAVGQFEKAIEAFQKSYQVNPNTTFAPKLLIFLIQSLSNLERFAEALKVAKDAMLLYPNYTDLCYEIGVQYKNLKYWKDAELAFLRCLEMGEVEEYLLSSLEGVGSYLAHAHLAEIYIDLGIRELAQKHITQSLIQNKMHFASLRIYLEVFVNVPPDDLLKQLLSIYTLDSSEEANLLMQALYYLRSPLFVKLSTYIRQDMSTELKAWIAQMKGELVLSKQLWLECEKITNGSQRDLLLLAMITKDHMFFKHFDNEFNLRTKDKSLLIKLINRESIVDAEFSQDFKQYFKDLCNDILLLRSYDVVEYLMEKVQVPMLRYELAELLYKFQFNELALECIMEPETLADKNQVYLLVGDILKDLKMYGDSYEYYLKVSSKARKYEVLYKIYDLAVLVEDEGIQREYIHHLNQLIPASEWAKQVRQC